MGGGSNDAEGMERNRKLSQAEKANKLEQIRQILGNRIVYFVYAFSIKKSPLSLNIGCDRVDKIVGLPPPKKPQNKDRLPIRKSKIADVGIRFRCHKKTADFYLFL